MTLITTFLVTGCAVQRAPQGGDKDVDAPRILASDPQNESVNFSKNKITLEFDEYVVLKGAKKELVVSPPLQYSVDFKMRNRKLFISWKDTLRENTTYLFQFGEGIVDLNENNALDSNVFVFSTGSYLDSFEIKGKITGAFDLKPVPDVWVMLYEDDIDSLPYKEIPRYFAKTNETGDFHLRYLKKGAYKLFALQSLNSGYLYDNPGESIAFLDVMVNATVGNDSATNDTIYELRLFQEEDSTQYLKSFSQITNTGIILEFNRTVNTLTLTELTGNEDVNTWSEKWSNDRDSVTYWFDAKNDYDSLRLIVDTEGFIDTLFLRKPVAESKRKNKKQEEATLTLKSSVNGKQPHFGILKLTSTTPVQSVDSIESWLFTAGADTVDIKPYVHQEFYGITIDYPWKQEEKYSLIIPDSFITDRFGLTNDSLKYNFTASRNEDFGQLIVSHDLPDHGHPYIWQLLLGDGKKVDERIVQPSGEISYEHLKTGKYQIRILYDINGNGIWDTGYYPGKRQPERVRFYDQPIEIRSNWASEIEWILSE